MPLLLLINLILIAPAISQTNKTNTELKCFDNGDIEMIFKKKVLTEKSSFCINHPIYKIISFSCIRNPNCLAITSYSKLTNIPNQKMGSPYHLKCKKVGGTPMLIKISEYLKSPETGICRFSDQSYISLFNSI